MPYTIDNPPEKIKGLPKHAQEIFIAAYNSAYEQYDKDETRANKVAWAAVKQSYEQDKDGKWVAIKKGAEKLTTVEIENVEILAVGKWQGHPKAVEYSKDDLDAIVKSFNELTANKKLNYEPPVKLGHDDKQKLLQEDGYPAAGWVNTLKRVGDKLVASFKAVPQKLADIIKAGGYKKVSSELYSDYEIGKKKYPHVLKAVALLGGDVPAVKTIKDIVAQYGEVLLDEKGVSYQSVIYCAEEEVTLDEIMSDLDAWLEKAEGTIHGKAGSPAIRTYLKEVKAKLKALIAKENKLTEEEVTMTEWTVAYINDLPDSSFAFVKAGGEKDEDGKTVPRALRMLPFKDADGKIDLDHLRNALARLSQTDLTPEEQAKARKILVAAAKEAGVGEYEKEEEMLMETELRAILKVDETANVLEAVKALVKKTEAPEAVSLTEHESLKDKVKVLETKLSESETKIALKERDERIVKAINSGKLTPAQVKLPAILTFAEKDPSGFQAFVDAQPVVVNLKEIGAGGGEAIELTEAEIQLGEKLGVSKEALIKAKKSEKK